MFFRVGCLALLSFLLIQPVFAAQTPFEYAVGGNLRGSFEMYGQGYDDEIHDAYEDRSGRENKMYMYEDVTIESVSRLLWGIGYLNIENPVYIDGYIKINECDLYKTYSNIEMEWKQIRAATKEFLLNNKNDFSLRYQFVQPLRYVDYDEKRHAFLIDPRDQYKSVRRFEVNVKDYNAFICDNNNNSMTPKGYTRSLLLELSRPFSLQYIPVEDSVAKEVLGEIRRKILSLPEAVRSQRTYTEKFRKAYILFKVKIFSYGKLVVVASGLPPAVQMMGALEGYEVYADPQLKKRIFIRNYVTKKDVSEKNARILKEFDILRDRSRNGGILTNIN